MNKRIQDRKRELQSHPRNTAKTFSVQISKTLEWQLPQCTVQPKGWISKSQSQNSCESPVCVLREVRIKDVWRPLQDKFQSFHLVLFSCFAWRALLVQLSGQNNQVFLGNSRLEALVNKHLFQMTTRSKSFKEEHHLGAPCRDYWLLLFALDFHHGCSVTCLSVCFSLQISAKQRLLALGTSILTESRYMMTAFGVSFSVSEVGSWYLIFVPLFRSLSRRLRGATSRTLTRKSMPKLLKSCWPEF